MGAMPFVSLGTGIFIGALIKKQKTVSFFEVATQLALILLMITIGLKVGGDPLVILNLPTIGLNCVGIALSSIVLSVGFVWLIERLFFRLPSSQALILEEMEKPEAEEKRSISFTKLVPLCLGCGILLGYLFYRLQVFVPSGTMLTCSLIVLYVGVGVSIAENKTILKSFRQLGPKVLLVPLGIVLGSLLAGIMSIWVFHLPGHVSIMSAAGMSYYSITGALMTERYGIEAGAYGFLVNVFREILTVLLLPLLVKLSRGSTVAAGAAGNMDTMLLPVIHHTDKTTGVVALVTGTILTIFVPFLLLGLGRLL